MPILRSRHQAELLALLLHPQRAYTLTELAERLAVAASTLHREVRRLLDAEIVTAVAVGRSRLLQVNPGNRHVPALTALVVGAFGPHQVIAEEFAAVDGVERLIIDLLIVGRPHRADVYEAAARASDRVGSRHGGGARRLPTGARLHVGCHVGSAEPPRRGVSPGSW